MTRDEIIEYLSRLQGEMNARAIKLIADTPGIDAEMLQSIIMGHDASIEEVKHLVKEYGNDYE